jgi:hypothetical protein
LETPYVALKLVKLLVGPHYCFEGVRETEESKDDKEVEEIGELREAEESEGDEEVEEIGELREAEESEGDKEVEEVGELRERLEIL